MEQITNWAALWRELVEIGESRRETKHSSDHWHGKAREFDERVTARWQQQDSSREFLRQTLLDYPESTVLDIGAGSGAWSLFLSPMAASVTALDPSESMVQCLREQVIRKHVSNIKIIEASWPDVEIEKHDVSLCSHAMYNAKDLSAFLLAMQKVTTRRCILLIRAPHPQGVMAQAARHLWGHGFDSPSFQIAYNVLLDLGIFPNVLMEDTGWWRPWRSPSIETALSDLKSRLGLFESNQHDDYLLHLLNQNLEEVNGEYVWPPGVRTALVYWDI